MALVPAASCISTLNNSGKSCLSSLTPRTHVHFTLNNSLVQNSEVQIAYKPQSLFIEGNVTALRGCFISFHIVMSYFQFVLKAFKDSPMQELQREENMSLSSESCVNRESKAAKQYRKTNNVAEHKIVIQKTIRIDGRFVKWKHCGKNWKAVRDGKNSVRGNNKGRATCTNAKRYYNTEGKWCYKDK